MGSTHLLFGRNVFAEALSVQAKVHEVCFENAGARAFAEEMLRAHRLSPSILRQGIPREIKDDFHQGLAFRCDHAFYADQPLDPERDQIVVLANHLEDVQNFGALVRNAVAFGASRIFHENRRSASLTPAAIKASAGQAFRMRFSQSANLEPIQKSLQKVGYQVVALDGSRDSQSLYDWEPLLPLAIIVGSEADGVAKPLLNGADTCLRIPMADGVESLNAAQAAGIALSWAYRFKVP